MFFLILAIISSVLISVAMRLSKGKSTGAFTMLATNYFICAAFSLINNGSLNLVPGWVGAGITIGFGIITGAVYLISLMLSQKTIAAIGVSLPTVFSKVGALLIPLAVSIACFGEHPSITQIIGPVLAIAAIIAINYDKDSDSSHTGARNLLFVLFIAEGFATAASKIFNEIGNPALSGSFLFFTFGSACVFSVMVAAKEKERPTKADILYGTMVGVPNFFSARFLLTALETVPAVIAYPVRGVLTILLISVLGLLHFGEKLKRHQWAAMAVILVSVALLNM